MVAAPTAAPDATGRDGAAVGSGPSATTTASCGGGGGGGGVRRTATGAGVGRRGADPTTCRVTAPSATPRGLRTMNRYSPACSASTPPIVSAARRHSSESPSCNTKMETFNFLGFINFFLISASSNVQRCEVMKKAYFRFTFNTVI